MGNELTGCPSMFEFFLVVRLGQSEFCGLKSVNELLWEIGVEIGEFAISTYFF